MTRSLPEAAASDIMIAVDSEYEAMRASGAASMLEAAEEHNIGLGLTDIAIHAGEEQPHRLRRQHKRQERWDNTMAVQEQEALADNVEFERGCEMAEWLCGLSPQEREQVRIAPMDVVDDAFITPIQLVAGEEHSRKSFRLQSHFGFDLSRQEFDVVPDAVRDYLSQKQDFWNSLGVTNGPQIDRFLQENFEYLTVDPRGAKMPAEIEWLAASRKEAADLLASGHQVRLRRLKHTPDGILDDIRRVSISQGTYVTPFLEPLIQTEQQPIITDEDREVSARAQEQFHDRLDSRTKMGDFRKSVLREIGDRRYAADGDFEGSLKAIHNLYQIALGLEVRTEGHNTDPQLLQTVDDLNAHLDDKLGRDFALHRMIRDSVSRNSEGLKALLKGAGVLTVGAEGVEKLAELPGMGWLKGVAFALGSMEDVVSEGGEGLALRAQGREWSDIRHRYGIILGVAAGCVALNTQVEVIGGMAGMRWAAGAYALGSCGTTMATLALSMRTYMGECRDLAAQGKLAHKGYVDAEQHAQLREALNKPEAEHHQKMSVAQELIENMALRANLDGGQVEQLLGQIEMAVHEDNIDKALGHVSPSWRETFRAAWHEVVTINPTRTGKMAAVPLMLTVAPLAPGILSEPYYYMPFSMSEPASGLTVGKVREMVDMASWHRSVHAKTAAILGDAALAV